jgi:transcription elongation factor Elf1
MQDLERRPNMFALVSRILGVLEMTVNERVNLEKVTHYDCPRCGQPRMNIYYSDQTDNRVGAWCENCNMKGYYHGDELIAINS